MIQQINTHAAATAHEVRRMLTRGPAPLINIDGLSSRVFAIQMKLSRFAILALALPAPSLGADWESVSRLLNERCVVCHSGDSAPLGLKLDTYAGLLTGSQNGAVVVPGSFETSPIYHRITVQAEPQMPLDGPPFLDATEIEMVAAWIAAGATGACPRGAHGHRNSDRPARRRQDHF